MPTHTLYAYVLPGESIVNPEVVVEQINEFIASRQWKCPDIWAVNHARSDGNGELGLNLVLPEPYRELTGWFEDVEEIIRFCTRRRRELRRDFVVGIADQFGLAEDIFEVESDSPKIGYLKKFIGIEPPSPRDA